MLALTVPFDNTATTTVGATRSSSIVEGKHADAAAVDVNVTISQMPGHYTVQITPSFPCPGGWWVPSKGNTSFIVSFACDPPRGSTFDLAIIAQPYRGEPEVCRGNEGFDAC